MMEYEDNINEINNDFEIHIDDRHAGGYTYFCRRCGRECNVGEVPFKCQCDRILPIYIICRYGCGRRWRLTITPKKVLH